MVTSFKLKFLMEISNIPLTIVNLRVQMIDFIEQIFMKLEIVIDSKVIIKKVHLFVKLINRLFGMPERFSETNL